MIIRCFQQKNALEVKQSGKTGPLLSIAQKIMDICVYQTKTSLNFWNSVTYIHVYMFKKVWKIDYNTLLKVHTKLPFIKITDSFLTVLILSRAVFIFGQTIFKSRFIQLPQVYPWMPWSALLLLWNISPWVNQFHIIFFSFQFNVLKIQNIYSCSKRHNQCSLTHFLSGSLRWPLAIGPHPSSLTVFNFFNSYWKLNGQLLSFFVQVHLE